MPTTTDPGAKLGAIAAALKTAFNGIEGMEILAYDPGISGVQASMTLGIGDVEGRSTRVGEAGTQLGKRDWDQRWTVRFYVFMDDPAEAWAAARKAMGEAINSLDASARLGGEVREAVLGDWAITPNAPDANRRILVGLILVDVKTLMTDPYPQP